MAFFREERNLQRFRSQWQQLLHLQDNKGDTPLHLASAHCEPNVVRRLLNVGSEVNSTNNLLDTPLHNAIRAGQLDNAALLLDHGANSKTENLGKLSSLNTLNTLLESDQKVNKMEPLQYAAHRNYIELVWLMLQAHPTF
jgi:ankyrin repeat protein